MIKLISPALLVGGIVLIIYGLAAAASVASDVSRFPTGNPTDKTMWLLIGGFVAFIVGATLGVTGLLRNPKSP